MITYTRKLYLKLKKKVKRKNNNRNKIKTKNRKNVFCLILLFCYRKIIKIMLIGFCGALATAKGWKKKYLTKNIFNRFL